MKHQPRSLRSKLIDIVRVFNKYILNRATLKLAEKGKGPYSVIFHIGRHSGRTYRTPVLALYVGEVIIIPLPYGENVDWLRNVLAKGDCTIIQKERRITGANPELIGSAAALEILPEVHRRLFKRFKTEKFLCLQITEVRSIQSPAA